MKTLGMKALVALVAVAFLIGLSPTTARAFWGHRQVVTTNYAMPSVPVTVGYAPVAVAAPIVAASPSFRPLLSPAMHRLSRRMPRR